MIQPHSIQKVLDIALIEEVIGEFVALKRSGANYKGLSPFTNEKTPSFVVSPSKQIFKCFSSGKGGGVINFLMEHDQLSYPEAIRWLAKKYQIELEENVLDESAQEAQKVRESLFVVNEFAKKHFIHNLWETEEGRSIGLSYFKERGLLETTIRKFDLGFALKSRQDLRNEANRTAHDPELLKALGLINKSGNDFFSDRVMFSICDSNGRPLAFAGRVMGQSAEGVKYINSPESEIYHKTKTLYGIHLAKNAIRKEDECILVEGYLDLLSLHQAGVENVVASSGTALTDEQIKLIKRHSNNICILYDADPAGIKAAIRGADLMLEQNVNVQICLLPAGQDPDDYIKSNGYQAFMDYKQTSSKDIINFRSELLLKESENDPIKKTTLIQELLQSIARIPDAIKRSVYITSCAAKFSIEENIIVSELNKIIKQNLYQQQRRRFNQNQDEPQTHSTPLQPIQKTDPTTTIPPPDSIQGGTNYQERDILRILMGYGNTLIDESEQKITTAEFILSNLEDTIEMVDTIIHEKIFRFALEQLSQGKIPESKHYIEHPDTDISSLAVELLLPPYEYSENWENRYHLFLETQPKPDLNVEQDALQAILRYKLSKINQQCRENQNKMDILYKSTPDSPELLMVLKVQKKLIDLRNEIALQLGTVVW